MICATCQRDQPSGLRCSCGLLHCGECYDRHRCQEELPPLWPSQEYGIAEVERLIACGEKRICLTSPTGGGKTRMFAELILKAREASRRVVLYTHRKLLVSQTSGVFGTAGIQHGVMAAGYQPRLLDDVQIASIWTVGSRVFHRGCWELPEGDLVFVDEAHAMTHPTARKALDKHAASGAVIIGVTATPVGLTGLYDKLVVAGTNSQLRECGALVPAITFGPDEPDLKHVGRSKIGEYVQDGIRKAIRVTKIYGSVLKNYRRLNPDGRPTILFAPGVPESRWFVKMFRHHGITAAHIDANTPDDGRQRVFEGSRDGSIEVVCSRFVLREGVDMPWIQHAIMATAFGTLSGYLQAGGRSLRAFPGKEQIVLQDHGGNWHRHGSLNANQEWSLDDTDVIKARQQKKKREKGEEKEPICCPKCGKIRMWGDTCPFCGHQHKKSVRVVIQKSGDLERLRGNVTKRKKEKSAREKKWNGLFYSFRHSGRTVAQLMGAFRHAGLGEFPTTVTKLDERRRVRDVFRWQPKLKESDDEASIRRQRPNAPDPAETRSEGSTEGPKHHPAPHEHEGRMGRRRGDVP